jgi:cytochrome o ubiquinol oxidase subunit I
MNVFGKLTLNAIPFDQLLPLIARSIVFTTAIAIVIWIILAGHLSYLWREWTSSVDHKRIGVMYTLLGLVMLVRGFVDAITMRTQQAVAFHAPGYPPPEHYDQVFSAHGTIMIFFAAMPLMIGLMNFAVPLQLGVRDVAFPTLNSTSFWLRPAAHCWSISRLSSASSLEPGGCPTHPCPNPNIHLEWASTTISGHC